MIEIEFQKISSFYFPSLLYQQYEQNQIKIDEDLMEKTNNDEIMSTDQTLYKDLISIPQDKYWNVNEDSDILDECNLAPNIDEFLRLLAVCDYWMFEELPWLVLRSYERLTYEDQQKMKMKLSNYPMIGEEFVKESILKLNCLVKQIYLHEDIEIFALIILHL